MIALATEIGAGNRYPHTDKDVEPETVMCTSANVKRLCFLARNLTEMSAAYEVTVNVPSFAPVEVPVFHKAEPCGDVKIRSTSLEVALVIEEDPVVEPLDPTPVAKAALLHDDVTVYT